MKEKSGWQVVDHTKRRTVAPLMLTRRKFIKQSSAGALAVAATAPWSTALAAASDLIAAPKSFQLLPPEYPATPLWSYGGDIPGPTIRVQHGGRVTRRLVNGLAESTSVHWHGIRIDNRMDGVGGLTQPPVEPGDTFDYDFIAPDAGTYWYHSHMRSFEQVARGMYGALIVEETTPPDVDREETLVLDDWLVDPETGQLIPDFGSPGDRSHGGRIGNYVVTNGTYNLQMTARQNERLRLRLINAANARIFDLRLQGLDGWIVALDGMPLAAPRPVGDGIVLAPAQRADLVVDVTNEPGTPAVLLAAVRGQALTQATIAVDGRASLVRRPAPAPLPPNAISKVDLAEARPLLLNMDGGMMSGWTGGTLEGEHRSLRELAEEGWYWGFNGAVGRLDETPFAALSMGEPVRLSIANNTRFPHAMHLHGMHFHEINADGVLGPLRDTTLLLPDQTRDIAFVADNPGRWLLHCHMLTHAISGMLTWLDVA
jgi:FtsP/CotA-like multicopper oxidase with cupredoxin domain